MGKRENKIEKHLAEQIEKHFDGITRKWVSPGHSGVPDQICFIEPIWFVEVKTADGVQEPHQLREALRLIKYGQRVAIVYGYEGVDKFIEWLTKHKYYKLPVQVVFK